MGDGSEPHTVGAGPYEYIANAPSYTAFALGWTLAMQNRLDEIGYCFVSVIGTMEMIDVFKRDWNRLLSEYNFYNIFIYDPMQFYADILTTYE